LRTLRDPDPRSSTVHVEIADTGVGMDEATLQRCLEPFFTTKGERGTGLGLAMVYGTVQRHGAGIDIKSELGRGTTVRLSFTAAPAATGQGGSQAAASLPRLRLLIVDDDPILLRSLREVLEIDGHIVTSASGGADGIAAFAEARADGKPFDAVITDLGMPAVDGRRVAASIKGQSPATPVILLTGWGERLRAEEEPTPHVDRVLSKPPKMRDVREALASCLPGRTFVKTA
jgi:CheY-like chemotaxis protein